MLAAGLTFLVNLLIGAFVTLTLPSLLIPFLGILMAFYRAVEWGFLFAPVDGSVGSILSPNGLTLVIEGQAYVLAAFAIYVHGKMFLQPSY